MPNVNNYFRRKDLFSLWLSVLIFLLLFVSYFHPITAITQDLGRHLLTGKIILTTPTIPKTNLYSYTYPTFPFINSHWLSEVIFYLLQKSVGFTGLLSVMTAVVLLTFLILFLTGRKTASVPAMATASLFLFPVLFERTDLRPELFSFFLFSIFLAILFTYREKDSKLIFLLPFLSLLWVDLHIYFLIGLIVQGLFLGELIIRSRRHLISRKVVVLAVVFIASVLLTLLNPNGVTGALYPFTVFHNYGYTIEENQNIFFLQSLFHKATSFYFEISFIAVILSLLLTLRKTRLIDWFLVITFSILGMSAIRNVPLFVIAVFLPFSTALTLLFHHFLGLFTPSSQRRLKQLFFISISFILLWQIIQTVQKTHLSPAVPQSAQGAVTYVLKHHLHGPIFNNFDIGSDLEYRLYPAERTFVDGRPEAYPASFFQNIYIPMQENPALFQKLAEKYHFQTILVSHTDQTPWAETFLSWIVKDPSWKITYLDDTMLVILPSSAQEPGLSDDPAIIEPYRSNITSLLQLAHFYSVVGWRKSLEVTLKDILLLDPHNCPALSSLAALMQQSESPVLNLYLSEYQAYCR